MSTLLCLWLWVVFFKGRRDFDFIFCPIDQKRPCIYVWDSWSCQYLLWKLLRFVASFFHVCSVHLFLPCCGFPFEWMDLVCVCMWQSIRWHWTLTTKPEPPNEMTVFFDIFPPLSLHVFLLIFWSFSTKARGFFQSGCSTQKQKKES